MAGLWEKLAEAKQYRWVDLTHTLTNESPYWEGIPQGSVSLGEIAVPLRQWIWRSRRSSFRANSARTSIIPRTLCRAGALRRILASWIPYCRWS